MLMVGLSHSAKIVIVTAFLAIQSDIDVCWNGQCFYYWAIGNDQTMAQAKSDKQTRTKLLKALQAKNPQTVISACKVLMQMGRVGKFTVPQLLSNLKSTNPKIRFIAIRALRHIKDEAAVKPMISWLKRERHLYVAYEAVAFFYAFADYQKTMDVVPPLIEVMLKKFTIPKTMSLADARFFGRNRVPEIVDVSFSRSVSLTIRQFGMAALPSLRKTLVEKSKSDETRIGCVWCLEGLVYSLTEKQLERKDEDRPLLLILEAMTIGLDDPSDRVRLSTLRALGRIGKDAEPIIETLKKLHEDPNQTKIMRAAVLETLRSINEIER